MVDIMKHYESLVNFLGNVLCGNFEIALLDLREGKKHITAIANGHISGRQINSPITNLAANILRTESWREKDFECNYKGLSKDKRTLRSSTFFIKDNDTILGMLCINIDDSKYIEMSTQLLQLAGIHSLNTAFCCDDEENHENFTDNIEDIIESNLSNSPLSKVSSERLTQNEKIDIVNTLLRSGVFQIRGAVTIVADRLNCSEATIYRYLSKIQKKSNAERIAN